MPLAWLIIWERVYFWELDYHVFLNSSLFYPILFNGSFVITVIEYNRVSLGINRCSFKVCALCVLGRLDVRDHHQRGMPYMLRNICLFIFYLFFYIFTLWLVMLPCSATRRKHIYYVVLYVKKKDEIDNVLIISRTWCLFDI